MATNSSQTLFVKFWCSQWWIPFWFTTAILGAGFAFSFRPAFVLGSGVLVGVAVHQLGWVHQGWWKPALRSLTFGASGVLLFVSLWGFTVSKDLGLAIILGTTSTLVLFVAIRKHKNDQGRGALYGWAASTNSGPWLTPLSTSISPTATQAVVTADFFTIPVVAYKIFKVRQGSTLVLSKWTFVDYLLPLLAIAGFLLSFVNERPSGIENYLKVFALVVGFLGMVGAVGSLLKESGHSPPPPSATKEFFQLFTVRAGVNISLSIFFYLIGWLPSEYIPIIIAAIFSIPTINPPSLAVLYGYRNSYVVHVSVRAGFAIATVGVLLIVLLQKFF